MAQIVHQPLTPAIFDALSQGSSDDDWLLASRLIIMKHAQRGGYPSPEVTEEIDAHGARRLSFYDGNGDRQMIVERAQAA